MKTTDHLGNDYENVIEMCKNYNIPADTYILRRKYGWTQEESLTTPVNKRVPTVRANLDEGEFADYQDHIKEITAHQKARHETHKEKIKEQRNAYRAACNI